MNRQLVARFRLMNTSLCVLALGLTSIVNAEETHVRVELKQSATPTASETVLVRSGRHDFKEPLRIPVESATPSCKITLMRDAQYIDRFQTSIETKEVNAVKTFSLLITADFLHKSDIHYEVRHTVSNTSAPLFNESFFVEMDHDSGPLMGREFSVPNRTGVDWGAENRSLRLVLLNDRRGVMLDKLTSSIPNTTTLRARQTIDCRIEASTIWIDPIIVKAGDAKQNLRLYNGAYGDTQKVRTELPNGVPLEVRRQVADPSRPLETATIPRDVPIGLPESVSVSCSCGIDGQLPSSNLTLDIGSRSDVHVVDVSSGPKTIWLPFKVTSTGVEYFTGVNRKVRIHNRSGASVPIAVSNVLSNDVVSVSKMQGPIDLASGDTIDLSDVNGFDLKLISLTKDQVLRTDAPKYKETATTLAVSLRSYLKLDQIEFLRQFFCTHPETRQKTTCMSPDEFKLFLEGLATEIEKSITNPVALQRELDELEKANESKKALTSLLREYSGMNSDKYAKERIRITSRIEEVERSIKRIETRIVPVRAEISWNANPKKFGFEGNPWEREPRKENPAPSRLVMNSDHAPTVESMHAAPEELYPPHQPK